MASDSLRAVRLATCLTSLVLVLSFAPVELSAQRARARNPRAGLSMHYENAEIATVADAVARAVGRRLVYGDELRGRISITVPERVSPDEALELLFAALFVKGFTAIPLDDETIRIVPILETTSGAPVSEAEPADAVGDRPITTLVALEQIDAEQAAEALSPYVAKSALAVAHPPTNSLILAGTESQLVRLITIARVLDTAAKEQLMVRTLRYRSVDVAKEMIETIFNSTPVEANHVQVWTDERTGQVIVKGHSAALAEVRGFLEGFDRPVLGEGLARVVRIVNRDAEEIGAILTSLASGPASLPAVPGRRNPAVADISSTLTGRGYGVEVDVPTQSLLITSDAETFEILSRVISELDRLPPRVSIEVLVFEVMRPRGMKLGINYFQAFTTGTDTTDFAVFTRSANGTTTTLPGTNIPATTGPTGPTGDSVLFGRYTRDPITFTLDTAAGPVAFTLPTTDVSIEAGERLAETNILLRPNIIGVSGEEHEVFSGDNIPVPTASTAGTVEDGGQVVANPLNVTQNIERVDVGTLLRVKPTLGEEGVVRVELTLELSQLAESRAGSVEEVGPTFTDRFIETNVALRRGEKAVFGATGATTTTWVKRGVPVLMNIPFLGWLFSTVEERADETDLIAVVEATVIRDADDMAAETIRRRLAFERSISRSTDLNSVGPDPFAVLLDTTRNEADAKVIAEAFASDGFQTRITPWDAWGQEMWDVYLTDLSSFEEAGRLARRLTEAGWSPEITVLSPINELAGE